MRRSRPAPDVPAGHGHVSSPLRNRAQWYALIAASFLFSFGLVPHTIYWFNYLARDLQLGVQIAGWHWTGVGVFAILGPIAAARLATSTSTTIATTIAYVVLGVGIALPWASSAPIALILSTIIFGAQPGGSTLLGARARDPRARADAAAGSPHPHAAARAAPDA